MNVPRYMYADGTENLIVIVVKCEAAMSIIKAEITLQIIALYCVTRRGQAYKSRTKSASCARIYFSCKHFCCAGCVGNYEQKFKQPFGSKLRGLISLHSMRTNICTNDNDRKCDLNS